MHRVIPVTLASLVLLALTGCVENAAPAEVAREAVDAGNAPRADAQWQLTDTVTDAWLVGVGGPGLPNAPGVGGCKALTFAVPEGADALDVVLEHAPVNATRPGAGQLLGFVYGPQGFESGMDWSGHAQFTRSDPGPGPWTLRVRTLFAAVNQGFAASVTVDGTSAGTPAWNGFTPATC